ncbi:uncharacterized protein [Elaeis guineensis]|uniref:Uncharacterized protein LOC105057027 n=1 Tax=Elaeis guineensis var. tenera TaxID=51953 RepID=A0A6I9S675_ELAGV|nr:uncharacterized protein LOC105057027 [Elaeis guineensis]
MPETEMQTMGWVEKGLGTHNKMIVSSNQCRGGGMMGKGGDDGLRTVECLRGRLLAERVASKAAKEQADNMAKRLEELERKIAEEIRYRNMAEKRLKHALKKLESLKILDVAGQMDLHGSLGSSSSSHCLSDHQKLEGWGTGSPTVDSEQCESQEEVTGAPSPSGSEDLLRDDVSGSSLVDSPHHHDGKDGSWSSVRTAQSRNEGESHGDESNKGGSPQQWTADAARQYSVDDSKLGTVEHQVEEVDNTLALVPASMQSNLEGCKPVVKNNVQSVLLALRHVKEQLQYSIGRTGVCSSKELYGQ